MQQHKKTKKEDSVPKSSFNNYGIWLVKNIFFLAIAFLLVKYTFSNQPAYNWVYNGLLKGNMETIKQYPQITFEQKMQIKLGSSYGFLDYIKQATPENAVLLFPPSAAFTKEGTPFTQEIYNKIYATRFLYPRKLILEGELKDSKYADKITHVVIVNGIGAEKLPYPVDSTIQHAVMPITPPKK